MNSYPYKQPISISIHTNQTNIKIQSTIAASIVRMIVFIQATAVNYDPHADFECTPPSPFSSLSTSSQTNPQPQSSAPPDSTGPSSNPASALSPPVYPPNTDCSTHPAYNPSSLPYNPPSHCAPCDPARNIPANATRTIHSVICTHVVWIRRWNRGRRPMEARRRILLRMRRGRRGMRGRGSWRGD